DQEFDLLVEVFFTRWETAWRGTSPWYLPNLFLWFQLLLPSYFIHDERYGLDMGAIIRVRSVHTGRIVYEREISAEYEENLNDFERGWQFLGILRVPGSLGPSNWMKVASNLEIGSTVEFEVALARALGLEFRALTGRETFKRDMRKRMSLVVGCTNYEHEAFPRALYARRDAEAFHDFLIDPAGGNVPEQNVHLLVGENAHRKAVMEDLETFLVSRLQEGDEAVVYFSGLGCLLDDPGKEDTKPARPYLIPYDGKPSAMRESAISLDDILEILGKARGKVIVVLDTSFSKDGGNRAFDAGAVGEFVDPTLGADKSNVTLLAASGFEDECGLVEKRRRGTFTFHFLIGCEGKGDQDEDGTVSFREAFDYAKNKTSIMALLDGKSQRPELFGPLDGKVIIKGAP
ncbi:MAG: caspase family protein, partial [Planctomycetota bacterium]